MDLGWQELVIILIVVVIIFGAGKLPEIGGALGKGMREFRQSAQDASAHAPAPPVSPSSASATREEL